MSITEDFDRFQCFNFDKSFLKNGNFFEKLKYRFLVESTANESALFPYKTVLSKSNVKTNSLGS